jgi:hypothetical protein
VAGVLPVLPLQEQSRSAPETRPYLLHPAARPNTAAQGWGCRGSPRVPGPDAGPPRGLGSRSPPQPGVAAAASAPASLSGRGRPSRLPASRSGRGAQSGWGKDRGGGEGGGGARSEESKRRGRARTWGGAGPSSRAGSPASWGAADEARSGCAGTPRFPLKVVSMGEGSSAPPWGVQGPLASPPSPVPGCQAPGITTQCTPCPEYLPMWPLLPIFNSDLCILTLPLCHGPAPTPGKF